MPRLLADSIRARTAWTLVAGVVAVLVVGVVIAALSVSDEAGTGRGSFESAMVALAVVADELPPSQRPTLYRAATDTGMILRPATPAQLRPDTFTRAMAERLRQRLQPQGITLLAVGHEAAGVPEGLARWWEHGGDIVARVVLTDGTALEITKPGHWSLPMFLTEALPVLLAVGGGLALLGVWIAARVTRPLDRFAQAAERLGRDARAAPLDETGPLEIRRAARVLNQAQRRIQRLLDDRLQMLGAIAHDLRTPLMRLYLRAELLAEPEQQQRMRDDLAEMEQLIDAALGFAREESVVESREAVDLGALLEGLVDDLVQAGHDAAITAAQEATVEAAPGALKRAFANLLDNAVRYGGQARVGWRLLPDRVEVTIDDTGPGMHEAELERVFAPFYRLERSRGRHSGGTGLGMTVARTALRSHGGDVTLANRPEGGLRQTVVLPRRTARVSG